MADRRLAAGIVVAAVVAGGGWMIWQRVRPPRIPEELFRRRCTRCHDLPDLSRFARHQIEGIVRTMREHNGADEVITEEEAAVIVKYLEGKAR